MKRFKIILFVLIFTNFTYGQASLFSNPQSPPDKKEEIPDPMNLRSNWWEYFNVDEIKMKERKEVFLKRLQNTYSQASSTQKKILTPFLTKIEQDLDILILIKQKKILSDLEKPKIEETYTIKAFSDLGNKLFSTEKNYASFQTQKNLIKREIKNTSKELDVLVQNYKKIEEVSFNKYFAGIQIIDKRIRLVIQKLSQIKYSDQIEQQIDRIKILHENITTASKNIIFSEESNKQIQEKLSYLKNRIQPLEQKILHLQDQLIYLKNNQHLSSEHSSTQRELINTLLQRGAINTEIVSLKFQETILFLVSNNKIKKHSYYHAIVDDWERQKSSIEKELPSWKNSIELDLENSLISFRQITNEKERNLLKQSIALSENSLLFIKQIEKNIFFNDFISKQMLQILRERHGTVLSFISNLWYSTVSFFKKHSKWFDEALFKFGDSPITPKALIKFFLIVFFSYIFAWAIRKFIIKITKKNKKIRYAGFYTLSRLIFYIILFIGLLIAFSSLGIDFTTFAVIAGALSVGIGFGLQTIFNNFVAGIILLLEKNIRIGDFIELEGGEKGTVKEINVRTTLLITLDNLEVLIPNGDLVSKKYTNWTLSSKIRRVHIPFGVAFGTDKDLLKKVVIAAAKKIPITMPDPKPDVWLVNIGESSLDFELIVWVNEYMENIPYMATKARYIWAVETTLRKHNIEIPYPVRDIITTESKK